MNNLPCIDCLCLPICKCQSVFEDNITFFYIRKKCLLLDNFLTEEVPIPVAAERVYQVFNIMTGKEL